MGARLLLINPNTSADFTARVAATARAYAAPETAVTVRNPRQGPASIESVYDELLSAAPVLELTLDALAEAPYDGVVIACYSDHPCIAALREVTDRPVLGIAEASMQLACLLGRRFSVVTTNRAWEPLLLDAAQRYGLGQRCASVRATGFPVLALEGSGSEAVREAILQQARAALETDGAEVICLGCAGMAGLDKSLQEALGVPVLDGVVCAVKLLEGLAGYGLRTSKRGAFSRPEAKPLTGLSPALGAPYAGRREQP